MIQHRQNIGKPVPGIDIEDGSPVPAGTQQPLPHPEEVELAPGDALETHTPTHIPAPPEDIVEETLLPGMRS